MEQNKSTFQIMQYPDYIFLLSSFAHIRVLMEEAGVGISGGIVLYIPNPNAVESVIHDLKECGGVIDKIRGSQLPSAFNYKAVVVRCQGNYKQDSVLEFLAGTEYLPVYLVSGILPEWLSDYDNIILVDDELDTDFELRLDSLNGFKEFSNSRGDFIIEILNSIKSSEKFEIFDESRLYQAFYCVGILYNHYLHVVGKALQLPSNYFDELDNTIRDAIEFDDFDLEVVSAVYKALLRYLDSETNILIGDIDDIQGELINAVAEENAILYDNSFYYMPDALFCQAMDEELEADVSCRLLKSLLFQEGVLSCNNTRSNYSIKKLLTSAYGESLRLRFLKFSREKLEEGQQLSLVERRQTYVSGKM